MSMKDKLDLIANDLISEILDNLSEGKNNNILELLNN